MDNTTIPHNSCIVTNSTYSVSATTAIVTTGSIVSLLIIFMNSLIVISVIKFSNLRSTCNILIANLAVTDLLVGAFFVPCVLVTVLIPHITDYKYGCILKLFIKGECLGHSIIAIFLISIDRLCAIAFPLKYKVTNTKVIAYWSCVGSWSLWLLYSMLVYVFLNEYKCSIMCAAGAVLSNLLYRIGTFLLGTLIICSFICFCITWRLVGAFNKRKPSNRFSEVNKQSRLMTLVFVLFLIFLTPILVSAVYSATTDAYLDNRLLVEWLALLSSFNSIINGVIYGLRKPAFRNAFIAILKSKNNTGAQSPNISAPYPKISAPYPKISTISSQI